MVVAMYHDQGHIPLKLLGFYDGEYHRRAAVYPYLSGSWHRV